MTRYTLNLIGNAVAKAQTASSQTAIVPANYVNDDALESAIIAGINALPSVPVKISTIEVRDRKTLDVLAFVVNLAAGSTVVARGQAATTIAVGSNGAVLPQATINVASTGGFDAQGQLTIGTDTVTYTGITSTTFTGCTGGTGTLSTSEAVTALGGSYKNDAVFERNIVTQLKLITGAAAADKQAVSGLES